MVEKTDEIDECMLNSQNFSSQSFALRKSLYCIFYSYNLLTWVCQDFSRYVEIWNLKVYFCLITHKKGAPENKDPPEGKELPNLSVPYVLEVIPSIVIVIIASCIADVTRVLKQAKRSLLKIVIQS